MPAKKQVIGLEQGTVRLVSYAPVWQRLFEEERRRLQEVAGNLLVSIEHIGSTAVPDMEAKPIIDIAARIRSIADLDKCVKILSAAGYEYKGEYNLPGRYFFVKGEPHTHYLHIVEMNSNHWKAWIAFRDYLRGNKEAAAKYARLKHELAEKYKGDRNSYTKAKSEFITGMLRDAGLPTASDV